MEREVELLTSGHTLVEMKHDFRLCDAWTTSLASLVPG